MRQSKQGLDQMGKAADDSAEKVRQSALKSANAYERVRTEVDKAGSASRAAAQKLTDATERAKLAADRHADAVKKYGTESDQAVRASKRLSDANKEIERAHKAAERAADQYTVKQKQAANAAQRAAQEMRRAGEEIDTAMPDGSKLDGFMDKLGQLGDAGSNAGAQFGGSFMAGFAPKVASIGSKGGPIGAAIAGVAVVGLAAGALLAKSIADGAKRQEDQNLIQAQLGLDEETAARLGRAASEAYMGNFGDSVQENMDTIAAAMQTGLVPRDASQAELQTINEQLATAAKTMKTDIPETARAAGQAIKTGLVKDGTEAMDLLVTASQNGLNISDDLLDTVNEYSTQWRKVGIDGETALGLIAQATRNGARDTDVAADAIKEFTVRATDGSKSTADALQGLGLNVGDITSQLAQGGEGARNGLDTILDKLREMPPSVEKNQIAAALFGTQWENLGEAFDHFDLSGARDELGQTAGATQRAADVMASGPGAAMQQARRTLEEATTGIKQDMAEAFGPIAADIADGIADNKDELVAFFADIVSAALDFGIAMGNTAAGFLHVWGTATGGIGDMVGQLVESIGSGMSIIGGLISHIPGLDGIGKGLESAGHKARGMGEAISNMGESAHGAANYIADELVPGMANARDRASEAGDEARATAAGMDILTASVIGIPDEKTILINDNSPETKAHLEELGFKVTTLPDGTVRVTADTAQGERTMDEFINRPRTAKVVVYAVDENGNSVTTNSAFGQGLGVLKNADGGIDGSMPDQAMIQTPRGRRGLIQWAEPETQGEAFIPLAPGKRTRSTSILSEVADRFGYRLASFADGGVTTPGLTTTEQQSMWNQLSGQFPDAVMSSGTRTIQTEGHADYHNAGKAIDITGSNMGAIAAWIAQTYPDSLELIHSPFNHNIKDGRNVGDGVAFYGADQMAAHADHVHWALGRQATPAAAPAAAPGPAISTVPLTQNPDGSWTSPDPAWAHLIERESGGNPAIVQGIQDANSGGNEASGLFQIAKGTWSGYGGTEFAPTAGQATPEQQAEVAARIFNAEGGSPWGSGMPGREDDAGLRAGLTTQSFPAPGNGPAATAPAGVQQVYVVGGRLDGATPATDTQNVAVADSPNLPKTDEVVVTTPLMRGRDPITLSPNAPNMRRFANGGIEDHTAQMVRPGDYRLWGEPETGGESYIPHARSKRPESLKIWAKTGRILGVRGFASGGFGGYTADTRDASAPQNLYDLLSLGAGLGFAGASIAGPYIGMARSGNWTLGDLAPTVSTSANDIPGLTDATREQTDALLDMLSKILQATKDGKTVVIRDDGPSNASISLTRSGR
ncbi:phage tail tape measure protein [Gordonia sp. GW1C4-4]|uniref:Phage tail tape measure protein n=1 Tax=Gordonia tangerina TaxID=2911060 RepID=A0ABS9DMM9_9ACTN|nr:phage tail tape measure protein [Gordonia tangerina]